MGLYSSKFGTNPFTFIPVVHIDVTPIVFDHFLEALSVRKRDFLARLDSDLCEFGSDAIFQLRNIRRLCNVYLRLHRPSHEKVTRGEVGRAPRPGQIGAMMGRTSPNLPWPPRSSDISPCDFFMCGFEKSEVYLTRTGKYSGAERYDQSRHSQRSPSRFARKPYLRTESASRK